jgi:transposase
MKIYKVTLEEKERHQLEAITRKGSHQSRKVINALVLLNCDEGAFNQRHVRGEDVARILQVSMRKIDRVKKRFVEEGLETALGGRLSRRQYERKADGEFEARLVALSCSKPPKGYSQWSLRLLADRVVELHYIDSVSHETIRRVLKKTKSSRGGASAGSSRPPPTPRL